MVNYFLEYQDIHSGETETSIYSSEEERFHGFSGLLSTGNFIITGVYEDEECYCHTYSENECACGNFK